MPSALLPVQDAADRVEWHLVPRFMLRVGGLPFDMAGRLAAPRTAAWAEAVLDGEACLREDGARLADALQECIAGHLGDPAARRVLINLRRDVFNGRAPRGLRDAERLLPPGPLGMLHGWLARREAQGTLLGSGSRILEEETEAGRAELRTIATASDLREGIQLSSPSLDKYLDGYLGRAGGRLSKRERRIERSLLEYFFRTTCKTSPFSTLTSVCVGRFAEGHGRPLEAAVDGWDKHSATRLNMAVLARLSGLMATTPEIRADLPVRATGGLEVHRDRVRYLRKLHKAGGDNDAAVTLDAVHESLFYLPAGELLAEVLDLLGGRTLRFGDVARQLCAVGPDRQAADVEEYLAALLRLGMLVVPNLQLDIHDPDPVRSYHRGLRELEAGWADRVAGLVERMGTQVTRFATAPLDDRRGLLSAIGESAALAHRELGHADVPVMRTLVYEDTTVPALTVTGDSTVWQEQLAPGLRKLASVLPAFDGNLVRRLVTKGFFVTRYGAGGTCEDFLSFAHEFGQDFYDNYNQRLMRHQRFDKTAFHRYDNWFKQDEITGIDRAREAVAHEITRRYQDCVARGTDLELDESFISTITGLLPPSPGALESLSFFLQVADNGRDNPLVVVNRVYSGLTLLFSRFAHLFDDGLTASLRASLDTVVPKGAVFAELKGGYDATNLNLHPVVTPYEVVCPGETSFRPPGEQITIDDLVVEHDAVADRLLLRSRRLGAEVIPVYLGFLLPMALPEIQQVLLNFSGAGMAQLDLWAGTAIPDSENAVLPRIVLGNVVVQRKTWRISADRLPSHTTGCGEQEWFLNWRRWRRDNELPRHVFAHLGGEHKPQYVDFDSYFSVQLLDTAARATESTVVLSEMLPGPDEQWLRDGGQRYVTELTMELDGTRTGR